MVDDSEYEGEPRISEFVSTGLSEIQSQSVKQKPELDLAPVSLFKSRRRQGTRRLCCRLYRDALPFKPDCSLWFNVQYYSRVERASNAL